MSDTMNNSLLILLVCLISLLTASSCLTNSTAHTTVSNQGATTSYCIVDDHDHAFATSSSGAQHHGTVKGKVADVERIADFFDKGSCWDKKYSRISHFRFDKKPPVITALLRYSTELLQSSHLVPATNIRV